MAETIGCKQQLTNCPLCFLVGIGVRFFIIAGINQASFDKLLQEGDYSISKKKNSSVVSMVTTVYWLLVTAVFLAVGFFTAKWQYAGLIWPITGVLFPAVLAVVKYFEKKE